MRLEILPCGEQAVSVQLSDAINETANRQVIALARSLKEKPVPGVLECVPTYRSLLVRYDPERVRGNALEEAVRLRCSELDETDAGAGRLWSLPVVYGGAVGQDLEELARMKDMTTDEVIASHSDAEYRVYMIGFAPGFAYLGGLPERLHTPRLPRPRQKISAGAVGIGGQQANINSMSGPSGWRFLGRTPVRIFDLRRENPFLLQAGDRVRFTVVDAAEAERMDVAVARGEVLVEPKEDR